MTNAARQGYRPPSWFDRQVFNPLVAALSRLGLSFAGSRTLEVRGRSSGQPRRNPVNPLALDGHRYLVAPRGQTQWVRNLRAAAEGELQLGARREHFGRVAPARPVFRIEPATDRHATG